MNALLTANLPPTTRFARGLLGLAAAAVLLATSSSAFAGKAEIDALNAQLAPKTIATATSQELANAVVFFTNPANNPKKLNPGTIAGEALKGATTADAGTVIGAALAGVTFPVTFGTKTLTKDQYSTAAIKATASGKGATVAQVPGYTQALYTPAQAVELAKLVKGTKKAPGAVLQGGASNINDADSAVETAAKATYLNGAVSLKEFASAIQDISRGVAVTVDAGFSVLFTNTVVTANAGDKNVPKVITGIVEGKPTDAGAITDAALNGKAADSVIGKAVIGLSKTIGAVADIEQIQKVGEAMAKRSIVEAGAKITTAKTIITNLAKAIGAKPFASLIGGKGSDPLLATADATLVKNSEKADELGELAAYFINALLPSTQFAALKDDAARAKLIADLTKAVVTNGKLADKATKPTTADKDAYTKLLGVYVAGSVALTIGASSVTPELKTAVKAALDKIAKGLAGKGNDQLVLDAIADAIDGTVAGNRFENGTIALNPLTDPETNTKNF